ncbi:MAG: trigger factor [Alphaproteobacteria bacterium]|nr:trigger factor [Alphaproteobacteria bacterium]
MQVKELKAEGLTHEMEITIAAKEIDAATDQKIAEIAKTIRQPGFRPGKVPLKIVKQKYGNAILGEVLEKIVNETSAKVMKDKKLEPAIQPKIEVKSKDFGQGNDLVYSMNVEVLPKFEITDLKGLKLQKLVAKPDAKSVDEALERIAANNTSTKKVETKRGAKEGDTIVFDFDGRTADDDVHHDGMKSEGFRLRLGSGQFIPGFEDQLIGLKVGESKDVKVAFPENYGATELAGRDAIFECKLHEIHEPAEAKIDDDFAKSLGLDDVKALKTAVEEQLQNELDFNSRLVLKKNLLDVLDEKHKFDVPPTMLEIEHKNILDQIELDRQRNPDADKEELSDKEKAEFKDIADRRVRLGLILSAIGRDNKLTVADQELQRAVITEAQKYPGQEKEVFDYYSKNPQALESLRAPIFEEKVVDYIVELAEVKEKEISPEELMKALDEDEAEEKPKRKSSEASAKDGKKAAAKKPAAKKAPAKKPASKKKAS